MATLSKKRSIPLLRNLDIIVLALQSKGVDVKSPKDILKCLDSPNCPAVSLGYIDLETSGLSDFLHSKGFEEYANREYWYLIAQSQWKDHRQSNRWEFPRHRKSPDRKLELRARIKHDVNKRLITLSPFAHAEGTSAGLEFCHERLFKALAEFDSTLHPMVRELGTTNTTRTPREEIVVKWSDFGLGDAKEMWTLFNEFVGESVNVRSLTTLLSSPFDPKPDTRCIENLFIRTEDHEEVLKRWKSQLRKFRRGLRV